MLHVERHHEVILMRDTRFYCSIVVFNATNGDKEIRTPDPLLARQVLSQLSYTPICHISMT